MADHFVAYHSVKKMGRPLDWPKSSRASFMTGKKGLAEKSIGNTVWVIQGTPIKTGTEFELIGSFTPDSIHHDHDSGKFVVSGAVVRREMSRKLLNDFSWFKSLYKDQNNFSFGFSRINTPSAITALETSSSGKFLASDDGQNFAVDQMLADIPETVRSSLISARVGQGTFRTELLRFWDSKCAVTGLGMEDILIASHIKSWADSDNTERLDPFNGLLLSPNLDKLFDKGLADSNLKCNTHWVNG